MGGRFRWHGLESPCHVNAGSDAYPGRTRTVLMGSTIVEQTLPSVYQYLQQLGNHTFGDIRGRLRRPDRHGMIQAPCFNRGYPGTNNRTSPARDGC